MLSAQIPFRGADESDLLDAIHNYKVRKGGGEGRKEGGRRDERKEDREEIEGRV